LLIFFLFFNTFSKTKQTNAFGAYVVYFFLNSVDLQEERREIFSLSDNALLSISS